MERPKKCLKCKGEMEKGIIADTSYATSGAAKWARTTTLFGVKDTKRIESYRCTKCGYLENYTVD